MEEAKAALAQPLLSPEALDSLYSTMASLRREIHANPEPGFEETKTNALLRSMLTTLAGIPESAFSDCAGTGLVVDMMGEGDFLAPAGASVRTIALRADMDALRMTEGNNGLPYRSANEGVAHLCGHDGHMASLVGAAALLRRRLSRVPRDCKVRLLFQPAEEGPGGAAPMVKGGCMQGVDEVYGYHNWPSWPLGHLKVAPGPVMAHPSSFEIVITGKGGHGSQPQFAVDPVLVSAHVIVALQSVVSRSVPSSEQVGPSARTLALTLAPTLALIPDLSRSRSRSQSRSQSRSRSRSRRCSVSSLALPWPFRPCAAARLSLRDHGNPNPSLNLSLTLTLARRCSR